MRSEPLHNYSLVFVVDDNRAVSKMIKCNLEDEDTHVIEADTDSYGMRILSERRVDLILVDLRLPGSNEWSILTHLRAKESLRNTPIIVISPEAPRGSLIKQFRPNDYIQAPFDMRDLLLRIRKVIGQKDLQYSVTM